LVQQKGNNVDFSLKNPYLTLVSSGPKGRHFRLPLFMDDGLFGVTLEPLQLNDSRYSRYPKCDVTPGGIFSLCNSETPERWRAKVLVSGTSSARILVAPGTDYDWNLQSFCSDFLAPPSIPSARRQYDPHSEADMSELSIRFLGVGTERLLHTIAISKGLNTPASKFKPRVPPLNFPPGRWKEGKTPKVSKGKISYLHNAGIGDVVCTDTFMSGDSKYRYGQAYVDLESRFGAVFPLRSRTCVGYPGRYYGVLRNTGVIPALFGVEIGSITGRNGSPKPV
jgi:hypothetical protein